MYMYMCIMDLPHADNRNIFIIFMKYMCVYILWWIVA